jgi:hypothetical protein
MGPSAPTSPRLDTTPLPQTLGQLSPAQLVPPAIPTERGALSPHLPSQLPPIGEIGAMRRVPTLNGRI